MWVQLSTACSNVLSSQWGTPSCSQSQAAVAHATWQNSSHRSQEQQLLLSSLKLFYKPARINYRRPKPQELLIATSSRPCKWALLHVTSCASPANADPPLLTTYISLPSHISKFPQTKSLNFFLHEDCPENLTRDFYFRNKLLGSNSTSKAQRTS